MKIGSRPRLSYANVMVTLLAFAVLCGGGAYAAGTLSKGSVGTKQLKRNAVTGAKVKNKSLKARDLASGVLREGPQGPQGLPGPAGSGPGFQASGSVNFDTFSSSPFGSTVVSRAVPPGSYFATATVEAQTVNATASNVICRLLGGSAVTTRSQRVNADSEPYNFTLSGLFQVAAGQTLELQCYKSVAASGARVVTANIVAVAISEVTGVNE